MDTLLTMVDSANDVLWNVILIVLLCGTGIYYTIRLRFIQIRKFGEGFRQVFGNLSLKGEKKGKGEMTSFQSVATAIAAQVGVDEYQSEVLPEDKAHFVEQARAQDAAGMPYPFRPANSHPCRVLSVEEAIERLQTMA